MSNFRITIEYAEGVKLNPGQSRFKKAANAALGKMIQELNGTVVPRHMHILHQRLKAVLHPEKPEVRLALVEDLQQGVQPRLEVYAQRSGGNPLWVYSVAAQEVQP